MTDRQSGELSFQAEAVVGAGRGAVVAAMFGAGWLGWGLGVARAYNGPVGPAFGLIEILLLGWAIYAIRMGRRLRRQYPPSSLSARRAVAKPFLLVVLMEVLALLGVAILARRLDRPDLSVDWCAMVVGLHFLPLAKIFRAPRLGVAGMLMTLWCVVCWVLFRANALVIAAAVGTGILLWGTAVSALLRAGTVAHSIE